MYTGYDPVHYGILTARMPGNQQYGWVIVLILPCESTKRAEELLVALQILAREELVGSIRARAN